MVHTAASTVGSVASVTQSERCDGDGFVLISSTPFAEHDPSIAYAHNALAATRGELTTGEPCAVLKAKTHGVCVLDAY